jgi:hypothetical protein
VPLSQFPTGDVYMVVQASAGSAEALTPLVRRVVARVDPDVPVWRDRTLETLAVQSTAGYRFRATMVGTFAALALVLAMVGVFGVLACTVQQRQREIGVRMALGATTGRVMWMVFRDAGGMIVTGAIAGMMLASFSGDLLSGFLFGVDPMDPVTFLSVPAVILVTAIVAAAAPACGPAASTPSSRSATTGSARDQANPLLARITCPLTQSRRSRPGTTPRQRCLPADLGVRTAPRCCCSICASPLAARKELRGHRPLARRR